MVDAKKVKRWSQNPASSWAAAGLQLPHALQNLSEPISIKSDPRLQED